MGRSPMVFHKPSGLTARVRLPGGCRWLPAPAAKRSGAVSRRAACRTRAVSRAAPRRGLILKSLIRQSRRH